MIGKESSGSGLEALLQNESCLVLQVLHGVSGKDMCGNIYKRGFSEIKKAKKHYSIWGAFFVVLQKGTCCVLVLWCREVNCSIFKHISSLTASSHFLPLLL